MTRLQQLLISAKTLAAFPYDEAVRRSARTDVRAFKENLPPLECHSDFFGADGVCALMLALAECESLAARTEMAKSLSLAVDAIRLEVAHIAACQPKPGPRLFWTGERA